MRLPSDPVVDEDPRGVGGRREVDVAHAGAVLRSESVEERPLPADAPLPEELVGGAEGDVGLAPVGAPLAPREAPDVLRQRVEPGVEAVVGAEHLPHLLGGPAAGTGERHAERDRDGVRRHHQVGVRRERAVHAAREAVHRRDGARDRTGVTDRSFGVGADQLETGHVEALSAAASSAFHSRNASSERPFRQ